MEIQSTATEIIAPHEFKVALANGRKELQQLIEENKDVPTDLSLIEDDGKKRLAYAKVKSVWQKYNRTRIDLGKMVNTTYKDLKSQIDAFKKEGEEIEAEWSKQEDIFYKAWKDEDQRKEAERQVKVQAEKERISAIRAKIEAIKNEPINARNFNSQELNDLLNCFEIKHVVDSSFAEFEQEAQVVKEQTLLAIQSTLNSKIQLENIEKQQAEEAERLIVERRLFEEQQRRIAKDQEDLRRAEWERLEEEKRKRDAEEAERQARIKAEQDEIDRQKAELKAQQDEVERIKHEEAEAIQHEFNLNWQEAIQIDKARDQAIKDEAEKEERLARLGQEDKAEKFYQEHLEGMSNAEAWSAVYDALFHDRINYAKDIAEIQLSRAFRNKEI